MAGAGRDDLERMKTFTAGIDAVIGFYGSQPDNLRRAIFAAGAVDRREGCTMTLWRDDKAMMMAAYIIGEHKEQLVRHQNSALFDRSSFTRGRIVASKGIWDGADPVTELAGQTILTDCWSSLTIEDDMIDSQVSCALVHQNNRQFPESQFYLLNGLLQQLIPTAVMGQLRRSQTARLWDSCRFSEVGLEPNVPNSETQAF